MTLFGLWNRLCKSLQPRGLGESTKWTMPEHLYGKENTLAVVGTATLRSWRSYLQLSPSLLLHMEQLEPLSHCIKAPVHRTCRKLQSRLTQPWPRNLFSLHCSLFGIHLTIGSPYCPDFKYKTYIKSFEYIKKILYRYKYETLYIKLRPQSCRALVYLYLLM